MRLLLINPNTSAHLTERMAQSARGALRSGDRLTAVTATLGPTIVRAAEHLAEAEASALALAREHAAGHDAIVLAISLDGAAPRLRASFPSMPVVGMTEAALLTACLSSERIGLLTLGPELLPLYRQRVEQIGIGARVVGYEAPEAQDAFKPDARRIEPAVFEPLAQACERLARTGAGAVVLAGAVLCGYADPLTARSGLRVLDGVRCAVRQCGLLLAEACTGDALRPPAHGA